MDSWLRRTAPSSQKAASGPGGLRPATGVAGQPRSLRTRRSMVGLGIPGAPDGAIPSVTWSLDGAGSVAVGALPSDHPSGAPAGKRLLWGEGVWPAEMVPVHGELSGDRWFIAPGPGAGLATVVVHGPDGDIYGSVDQPWLPGARLSRVTTGMRRDARRLRISVGGRVSWVRAASLFGVRVVRDDGVPLYGTHGLRSGFAAAADNLDISVVLLTLGSVPSSAYAPVLGF